MLWAQSEEVFALLSSLCPPGPVFCLSPEEAALAKLCANAYLSVRLAFFGEAADCCAALGADYARVAAAVGADLRIGGRYLDALGGFGGSCLPKDTAALASAAPMAVAEAALRANALRLRRPLGALHRYYRSAAGLPLPCWAWRTKWAPTIAAPPPACCARRPWPKRGPRCAATTLT